MNYGILDNPEIYGTLLTHFRSGSNLLANITYAVKFYAYVNNLLSKYIL